MAELFGNEELLGLESNTLFSANTPVTVLGKTFASDTERSEYFRAELRKRLPELKTLEGFPLGEDDDIINLSDPPYYTACPNPWLSDFVSVWEEEKAALQAQGKRKSDFEVKDPYASDVSEGKNNPIYNAHSYHIKVPHPAVLGDLSPVASFIAYNYNTSVNAKAFESEARRILREVEAECLWMYQTRHTDGSMGKINYVVWSDVFICPDCGGEIVFWDAAVDKEKGEMRDEFACPTCGAKHTKKTVTKCIQTVFDKALNKTVQQAKTVPVLISYFDESGKRHEKQPDDFDFELVKKIDNADIPYWFPTDLMMEKGEKWGETWRAGYCIGITNVHQFYTKRNLYILSAIKAKCNFPLQNLMFNSQLINISKMNRFRLGVSFPYNPLSGTIYISSLISEASVFKAYENKISRLAEAVKLLSSRNILSLSSAEKSSISDNSIDYIFTDPPFGANIIYSELNFIQESWLKVKTNNKEEAVESRTQNKGLFEYLEIMQKCFAEYYRVLKSGHWITVEFSNTNASVWNGIQNALNKAGFIIANVSAIDKKQGSFNAVTTPTAVKQDLVISCYKPSETFTKNFLIQDGAANTWSFVAEQLEHLPIPAVKDERTTSVIERSPKVLYDRLITYFFMRGLPVPLDAADFQQGLRARFASEDGMVFTGAQLETYRELKKKHNITDQPSLFVSIIENESDAIQWLKEKLAEKPLKYQDIQPEYRKAYTINRKGETEVELRDVLAENFIQEADGAWRCPDLNEQKDREALRTKQLLKIWQGYVDQVEGGKVKRLKDVRLEAVKAGFKDCYQKKDFARIVLIGDKISENLLTEDEMLLNYYDIACGKV